MKCPYFYSGLTKIIYLNLSVLKRMFLKGYMYGMVYDMLHALRIESNFVLPVTEGLGFSVRGFKTNYDKVYK